MMNRLFVASLTISCLLAVVPHPCQGQTSCEYAMCVREST